MEGSSSSRAPMYSQISDSVQLEMGNTRTFSPAILPPLYRSQSSGRWRRGSQPPKESRMEKMRSLARARSSSRRAPPHTASYSRSAMVSTNGTDCSGLRVPSGRSCRSPRSIQSWTRATCRRAPDSSTRRSRKSITSGKLCPVSTWRSSNGTVAGAKARRASSKTTTESLPPEKRMPTLSNWPATSRRM